MGILFILVNFLFVGKKSTPKMFYRLVMRWGFYTVPLVVVPFSLLDSFRSLQIPLYGWFILYNRTYPKTLSFSCKLFYRPPTNYY